MSINSRYYGYSMEEPDGFTFSPLMDQKESEKFRKNLLADCGNKIDEILCEVRNEKTSETR